MSPAASGGGFHIRSQQEIALPLTADMSPAFFRGGGHLAHSYKKVFPSEKRSRALHAVF